MHICSTEPGARQVRHRPLSAIVCAAAAFAAPATAQTVGSGRGPAVALAWDAEARNLMNQGRLDEARAIIEARLAQVPRDVQARFLGGLIALARSNHQQAIREFRAILIDEPGAARVRLELARAFFLAKDYGNALRHFQFALAGDPPAGVKANIRQYMATIRQAKSLSYSLSFAVAPDSNLNGGSSAREVSLFGLPFDLDEDARKRSGVGLQIEAGGEWAPHIGTGKRLRIGLHGQRREYKGSNFDEMTAAAYAGPRIVAGKWDLSLLGTAYRRWHGSRPYSKSLGGRLESTYHVTPRIGITTGIAVQSVRYEASRVRDGWLGSIGGSAYYALTPTSALTLKLGASREKARLDAFSNRSGFVAIGYFRELPMGFSGYIEPSLSHARYDEALAAFGRKRSDWTPSLTVTLLNRHIVLDRFTPRIAYTYTRQSSSIPLYEFARSRVEVGLTTSF